MADDDYADDLDTLTSLLDEDETPKYDSAPYKVKKEDAERVSQKVKERFTSQDKRHGSGSSQESVDEAKSKEELLEELQRMRDQLSQMQRGEVPPPQSSRGHSQTKSPPKETFSDALFSQPSTQKTRTKTKPETSAVAAKEEEAKHDDDGLSDLFGDISDEDDDDEAPEETPKKAESLFGKNKQRQAHTPQTSAPPPKKVSPYKCKQCDKTFDKLDAMTVHEFKHKVVRSNCCDTCSKSFTDKLQLQTHLRTHKISKPADSVGGMSSQSKRDKLSGSSSDSRRTGPGSGGRLSNDAQGHSYGPGAGSDRPQGVKNGVPQIGSGSKRKPAQEEGVFETEYFSRIRIINPLVSSAVMKERMKDRKMIRMSILNHYSRTGDLEGDWVTMGVVVRKLSKTDAKGKPYSIWVLNDLSALDECVALFLFGKVYDEHWKTAEGSVIGVLNATIMEKRENNKSSENVQLRVDHPQKLLLMGKSKDFGHCRGTKKNGQPCSQFINIADCQHCVYHVQSEYKKMGSKRTDLSSSYSGITPKSYMKKLQKDNYFYGGQSMSVPSMSLTGGGVKGQSKMTNHCSSNKLNLKSLGVKGAEAIVEEAKNNVLTLHGKGKAECDMLVKVSGASKELTDLLKAPTPGTQNLMRHMVTVERSKKTVTVSATSLLKQHQSEMASKRAARRHPLLQPSPSGSPSTSRQRLLTDTTVHNTNPSPLEDTTPKLGRGWSGGEDIDLDTSPVKVSRPSRSMTTTELARQRALALIKQKGQIRKEDPNAVKTMMDGRKRAAMKRRAEDNRKKDSLKEDPHTSCESRPAKKRKTFLGQDLAMSKDEMDKIMSAKSSHAGLLAEYEAELLERYFKEMEKKEGLENKLDSIREVKRKVVSCKKCSFTWFFPSDLCKKEQHTLHWHEATQRFFRCRDCNSRTIAFDRIPNKACRSCGGTRYERATMLKERDGPKIGGETLQIRGEEQKWVS